MEFGGIKKKGWVWKSKMDGERANESEKASERWRWTGRSVIKIGMMNEKQTVSMTDTDRESERERERG